MGAGKSQLAVASSLLVDLSKYREEITSPYRNSEEEIINLLKKKLVDLSGRGIEEVSLNDINIVNKLVASLEKIRHQQDLLGAVVLAMEEFVKFLRQEDKRTCEKMKELLPKFFNWIKAKEQQR